MMDCLKPSRSFTNEQFSRTLWFSLYSFFTIIPMGSMGIPCAEVPENSDPPPAGPPPAFLLPPPPCPPPEEEALKFGIMLAANASRIPLHVT